MGGILGKLGTGEMAFSVGKHGKQQGTVGDTLGAGNLYVYGFMGKITCQNRYGICGNVYHKKLHSFQRLNLCSVYHDFSKL